MYGLWFPYFNVLCPLLSSEGTPALCWPQARAGPLKTIKPGITITWYKGMLKKEKKKKKKKIWSSNKHNPIRCHCYINRRKIRPILFKGLCFELRCDTGSVPGVRIFILIESDRLPPCIRRNMSSWPPHWPDGHHVWLLVMNYRHFRLETSF